MSRDDDALAAGFDPAEMRDWMTTGAGADLTGTADTGTAPVHLLPEPGTPLARADTRAAS